MAYSEKDWDIVKAFYEEGFSLAEIVDRPEVKISDRSSIQKKAAKLGWKKGKNSTLFNKEIQAAQLVNEIQQEKSTLNSTALAVHNDLVTHELRLKGLIQDFSYEAMTKAGMLLAASESGTDFKAIVEAVDKISITNNINKRHAEPSSTNIQNNMQNNFGIDELLSMVHEQR